MASGSDQWKFRDGSPRVLDPSHKFGSKPRFPSFIPFDGMNNVVCHLWAELQSPAQLLKRERMDSLMVSKVTAVLGSFR
jgi:hypothetical protein